MKFLTSQKNKLMKSGFALALLGFFGIAHAVTPEQEVQQLRAEVNALKSMVEAQNTQKTPKPMLAKTDKKGFSFETKNGTEVAFYGFVHADAVYKLKGTDGSVFNDVVNATSGNDNHNLETTLATSRFGFDFKTPAIEGHKVGGKLEADFVGSGYNGNGLRIRHAFLTYDNWLIGQTWSTYNDLNLLPNIIDFNLIAGQVGRRLPMIRYETNVAPATKVAVALEKSNNSDRSPNLVGRVQQKFAGDKGLVSARAFVGEYHRGSGDNDIAWGTALGASYTVNDKLRLMGDYNHIKGNNHYIFQIDTPLASTATNGDITLNEVDTLSLGANYKLTPKVEGAVGAGYIRAKDNGVATLNKTVKQGFANIVYKPVPMIGLGLEYVHGEAEKFNGTKGTDQRIGVSAHYSF